MTERLVISLGADGRVQAHTEGIVGSRCLHAVPLLEDLLDAVAIDSSYTSDFHQTTTPAVQEHSSIEQENA